MAVVEGGKPGLPQALHDCQHGRVHETQVLICIPVGKLPHPAVVVRLKVLDPVGPCNDVVEEPEEDPRVQAPMNPVVHFNQDRSGNDPRLISLLDESTTGPMVLVAPVERSVEGPGIED